jgi:hypothetical protein
MWRSEESGPLFKKIGQEKRKEGSKGENWMGFVA